MTLHRQLKAPQIARSHVRRACADMRPDISATAELLTSELVTNAVMHGEGLIELMVTADGETLCVEVSDDSSLEARLLEAGPEDGAGRGLHVVEAYALAWGATPRTEQAGKSVWFTLRCT